MEKQKNPTRVTTGKVRFSFAHVWKPVSMEEGRDPKFSLVALIPKKDTTTVTRINAAIEKALELGADKFGGKVPKNYKHPLRDGDEEREGDEIFEGHYFINMSSYRQPKIVDENIQPILDQEEFYSGCYGRVAINFYAFNVNGNKGVAAGLENIQKLEDGERLGGSGASPEDDFGDDLM